MFQSIYEISDVYDAPSLSPLCTCKGNHIIIHLAGQSTGSNFTDYKMIDQYCNFVVDKLSGSGINSVVAVGTVVSSWKELGSFLRNGSGRSTAIFLSGKRQRLLL